MHSQSLIHRKLATDFAPTSTKPSNAVNLFTTNKGLRVLVPKGQKKMSKKNNAVTYSVCDSFSSLPLMSSAAFTTSLLYLSPYYNNICASRTARQSASLQN